MNDLDPSVLKQYYKGYHSDSKERFEVSELVAVYMGDVPHNPET